MKKLLSIMMTLAFVFVLAGCGGGAAADEPYMGNYTVSAAEMMGVELTGDEIPVAGWTMEIGANGKGSMDVDGDSAKLSYTVEGSTMTIDLQGEELVATIGDGTLTFDDFMGMGLKITFSKDAAAADGAAAGDTEE